MRYLSILLLIGVTLKVNGQQINPVPDYIFRNSMSVGRNAPTDTSAYFSIGPRFGATRGFMPPMVVDTASVTGTKRNGLLIYSIQRNSFLYWDSTGSRWSRIAANLDTLQLSTRAWRQKGIDSIASVRIGGSGTTNYVPKFTAASTLGNSQIFDNGTNIGIGTITPGQKLDIVGNTITRGYADVNNGTHFVRFQMPMASGTTGLNTFISNASGTSLTGSGNDASYNVIIGHSAGTSLTTGGFNTAVGTPALQATTTGIGNTGIGSFAAYSVTTGIHNTGVGFAAIGSVSTASNNTAVGRDALGTLTTGANNVGIGWRAGHFRSTSQSNSKTNNSIFIGYDTRSSADSVNNVIAIGTSVIDNGSNTTTIGNSSTVGTYIPAGESYFGTTTDNGDFRVQVSGNQYISGNLGIGNTNPVVKLRVDNGNFIIDNKANNTSIFWYQSDVDQFRVSTRPDISLVQMLSQTWDINIQSPDNKSVFIGNNSTASLLSVNPSGNVGIRQTTFGTSASRTFAISSGTAPSTSPTDAFQLYSADITAGNAAAHFRTENGAVIKIYQETTGVAGATRAAVAGNTVSDADTFDGYTVPQIVKALRNLGILQ
jgi:hypothetical protein